MNKNFRKLNEYSELCKGIFWFKDLDDIYSNDIYFQIPCDEYGNSTNMNPYDDSVLGKSGDTFNHKKLWSTLSNDITENKPFDYFPRGRVEINNGKAIIYIPQCLVDYQDEIIDFVQDRFNINSYNGINEISIFVDGSEHYKPKMFED